MQIVVNRADGGRRSSERIIAPVVFVPVTILSIELLVETRIVHVNLMGADSHDWTLTLLLARD